MSGATLIQIFNVAGKIGCLVDVLTFMKESGAMCGRFKQSQPSEHYLRAMNWALSATRSEAAPRFNVAPGMYRPVMHITPGDGVPLMEDLHWGYQASWAANKIPVAINARLEKIAGKYWGRLLQTGRAVVPADGWYEWTGEKGQKQPWHIHPASGETIFMAALAHFGPASDNKAVNGFTIVTADALGGMVDIHDRRPVVFSAEDARLWMDPDLPAEAAEQLARSQGMGPDAFQWHRVNKALSNVRNDGPALMAVQNDEQESDEQKPEE